MARKQPELRKLEGVTSSAGRQVYLKAGKPGEEGELVSEKSSTFQVDGKWLNAPSIYEGKRYTDNEVILSKLTKNRKGNFVDPESGRALPFFGSVEEAEAAAKKRSKQITLQYEPFNPQGSGYDYQSAIKALPLPKGPKGHWPSRVPETGLLLKGRQHETWQKAVAAEKKLGMGIFQAGTRSYSQPVAYSNADKQRLLDLAFLKGQRQK